MRSSRTTTPVQRRRTRVSTTWPWTCRCPLREVGGWLPVSVNFNAACVSRRRLLTRSCISNGSCVRTSMLPVGTLCSCGGNTGWTVSALSGIHNYGIPCLPSRAATMTCRPGLGTSPTWTSYSTCAARTSRCSARRLRPATTSTRASCCSSASAKWIPTKASCPRPRYPNSSPRLIACGRSGKKQSCATKSNPMSVVRSRDFSLASRRHSRRPRQRSQTSPTSSTRRSPWHDSARACPRLLRGPRCHRHRPTQPLPPAVARTAPPASPPPASSPRTSAQAATRALVRGWTREWLPIPPRAHPRTRPDRPRLHARPVRHCTHGMPPTHSTSQMHWQTSPWSPRRRMKLLLATPKGMHACPSCSWAKRKSLTMTTIQRAPPAFSCPHTNRQQHSDCCAGHRCRPDRIIACLKG
eukprot:m.420377 g.420377  ORF g.420377 m.420377 type:complete len:411 (-) comp21316_c0_seq10:1471-2703(-)